MSKVIDKWKKILTPKPTSKDIVHPLKFEEDGLWDKEVVMTKFLDEFPEVKDLVIVYTLKDTGGVTNIGYMHSHMDGVYAGGLLLDALLFMKGKQIV